MKRMLMVHIAFNINGASCQPSPATNLTIWIMFKTTALYNRLCFSLRKRIFTSIRREKLRSKLSDEDGTICWTSRPNGCAKTKNIFHQLKLNIFNV